MIQEPRDSVLYNDLPSADEDVARLRLTLRNTSLSTLVEHGFLTVDQDETIVRKGPRFDGLTPLFNRPDAHDGELPEKFL